MEQLEKLTVWTQRVLPQVYDDSLSYSELLNKVVAYLNDVVDSQNAVTTETEKLLSWFNNLDVQSQINKKLDSLVVDGTIEEILNEELFGELNDELMRSVKKLEPDSVTWAMIAQDAREQITSGVTAVVGVDSVGKDNVVDGALTIDKLDDEVTDKTVNLFNKRKVVKNVVVGTDGTDVASEATDTTHKIYGASGQKFTVTQMRAMAFYTPTGALFQHVNDFTYRNNYTFTVPVGASSFVISYAKELTDSLMVVSGGVLPTEYREHKEISMKFIPHQEINEMLENKYFERTSNMFDNTRYQNGYIEGTGAITANTSLVTTHLIPVKENDVLYATQMRALAMYDADGGFISTHFKSDAGYPSPYSVSIPANVKYVAVSFKKDKLNEFMVTINSPLGAYAPYMKLKNGVVSESNGVVSGVNIPKKIYATINNKLTILDANIKREEHYRTNYDGVTGLQKADRYEGTFTSTGTKSLTVSVYDKDKLVQSKNVSVVVSSPRTTNKRVLLIGDSTINSNGTGEISKKVKDTLGGNVTLLGTRGSAPYLHEGRGGWTADSYNKSTVYEGVANPFYNPNTGGFDLSYYLTQTGQAAPDVVIFQLGINDTFNTLDVTNTLNNFDKLVNSIKNTNPSVKIALNVTIPPNASQDVFGTVYGLGQTQWRYRYNNFDWVSGMIQHYEGNVDLISTHVDIDTNTMFTDGVHPNTTGYGVMANHIISYLNHI